MPSVGFAQQVFAHVFENGLDLVIRSVRDFNRQGILLKTAFNLFHYNPLLRIETAGEYFRN
jgi:hypothetical protein